MRACTCVVTQRTNLDSRKDQVKLNKNKEGKREGMQESRIGEGEGNIVRSDSETRMLLYVGK